MIIVDTSAWIEEIRGTGSMVDLRLVHLQDQRAKIVVTEPVVMELLAGARTNRELIDTRRKMLAFPMVQVGGLDTYERAAVLWRSCHAAGETVRTTLDCLIAAVAIREGASVLHADRDFDVIARHTPLRVEPVR